MHIYAFLFLPFSIFDYRFSGPNRAYPRSAWTSLWDKVRPHASEGATDDLDIKLWTLLGTLVFYISYAVIKDLTLHWPTVQEICEQRRLRLQQQNSEIEPQASEMGLTDVKAMSTGQHENVKFEDAQPGFIQEVKSSYDSVRDAPMNTDATLDNFFSRPLLLLSKDWGVGNIFTERINPWQLYFENARVINRIANYRLLQAKLHVKVLINGNSFHYGRAIVSYNPLHTYDDMTIDRAFVSADLVAATQRPHIFLDPTNSQGGEMVLPFFTPDNVLDIPAMGWRQMGELVIHTMQPLKHANGTTDNVTISVFAWATDVKFSVPTQIEPGAILPQADEYGDRPVSRIAGAVANFASYLVDAPYIGAFARATEIGASAVGKMATLFGYSSPPNLEFSTTRLVPVTNYSVTNMPSDVMKLTVDAKQELTVDPTITGLGSTDEMTINSIVQHQSWFTNFDYPVGSTPGTLLWNTIVDPCVQQIWGEELHFPATCFAAMPFLYWRGTLKYRFQIVCSKFHKGRLRIVYDPVGNAITPEYNTAYTTIVDISDTTDFTIDVGWGQIDPYRKHLNPGFAPAFGSDRLTYNSSSTGVGNGTLSVYVLNELTVADSTTNNDIQVNVFISACEDFEVAVPVTDTIRNLRLTTSTAVEPQAEEISEEQMKLDSAPVLKESVNTVGNMIGTSSDPTNLVYFGESIKSLRQLIKRYNAFTLFAGDGFNSDVDIKAVLGAFPFFGGYFTGVIRDRFSYLESGVPYAPAWMTFLNYVSCAYGGRRGSVRWLFDATELNVNNKVHVTVQREKTNSHWSYTGLQRAANVWLLSQKADTMNFLEPTTHDGALLNYQDMNSIIQWEVPYQKNKRFVPAKRKVLASAEVNDWDEGHCVTVSGPQFGLNRAYGTFHVAAGEDFSCFFFLGAPIFYLELEVPGGTP